MERRWVDSGDVSISFLDSGGTGPPVVILHGLAGSATEFIATAQALPEHRVLLVDQRGHGQSTRVPADTSRSAFVGDVVRVIEAEVGHSVALIGQSMGAHTAMMVAASRPDLVERLLLLEGGAGAGDPRGHAQLGDYFRSWPVPFSDREAAAQYLGGGPLHRAWAADLEKRVDGYHPRFDSDVMVRTIEAVATPRWEEWASIAIPTLVVYAESGMFSDESKAEFVRRGRNVRRVDIAAASHDAHLDAFDDWIAVAKSFLADDHTGHIGDSNR